MSNKFNIGDVLYSSSGIGSPPFSMIGIVTKINGEYISVNWSTLGSPGLNNNADYRLTEFTVKTFNGYKNSWTELQKTYIKKL